MPTNPQENDSPASDELSAAYMEFKKAIETINESLQTSEKSKPRLHAFFSESIGKLLSLATGLANLAIFVTLFTYISEAGDRHQAQIDAAWETVLAGASQPGDAGRRNALEWLNSTHPGLPIFGTDWPPQSLDGIHAEGAILRDVQLQGASLYKAGFKNADLSCANLSGTDLTYADLRGADLLNTDLSGADLSNADLRYARVNFNQASSSTNCSTPSNSMTGADLFNTNLSHATFFAGDLSQVRLKDAELTETILLAVNLRDAKDLQREQLIGENPPYLCKVVLPTTLEGDIDPNRDCADLPKVLMDRFGDQAPSEESLKGIIELK